MAETVQKGKVVLLRFELHDADTGERLNGSGGGLTPYLHGHGNLAKGLEAVLEGMAEGSSFDVTLEPADAYGEREGGDQWPQAVPRKEFPRDMDLRVGTPFRAQGTGDNRALLWVVGVRGSRVMVDPNHPLAGKRVQFSGEIAAIRDPTPEEHAHGHAHGVDGQGGH